MQKQKTFKKKYLTKKRRIRIFKIKAVLVLVLVGTLSIYLSGESQKTLSVINDLAMTQRVEAKPKQTIEVRKIESETIRVITAYNLGDRRQTDDSPCIGAYSKVNLCEEVAKGTNVCAANFVPLGTSLLIEAPTGWTFQCIVWDRLNKRYPNRVDIAMNSWEHKRAIKFGKQRLKVKILGKAKIIK